MAGARVDVDVAARARRHAADLAQIDVVGERQRVCGIEVQRGRRSLRAGGDGRGDARDQEYQLQAFHGRLLSEWLSATARLQDVLLHAPRFDLAQDDLVGIAAVHHVHHLEPGRDLARLPELADHRAIELRLVDLTRRLPRPRRVAVRVRIGMEDVLMRPRRDAQRPADPEVGDLANRLQVVVEHLIPVVGAIGHPHVAALVDLKSVRQVELAEPLPGLLAAGLREEASVLVVLHDAVVAVAVRDEDVPLRIPSRRRSGGRRCTSATGGFGPAGNTTGPSTAGGRRPSTISTLPVGAELGDQIGSLIDGPDVVVFVHTHRMGELEAVITLPDLLEEGAIAIELEQPGGVAAVIRRRCGPSNWSPRRPTRPAIHRGAASENSART